MRGSPFLIDRVEAAVLTNIEAGVRTPNPSTPYTYALAVRSYAVVLCRSYGGARKFCCSAFSHQSPYTLLLHFAVTSRRASAPAEERVQLRCAAGLRCRAALLQLLPVLLQTSAVAYAVESQAVAVHYLCLQGTQGTHSRRTSAWVRLSHLQCVARVPHLAWHGRPDFGATAWQCRGGTPAVFQVAHFRSIVYSRLTRRCLLVQRGAVCGATIAR